MAFVYDINSNHTKKVIVQKRLLECCQKNKLNVVCMPSITQNDLRIGFENGLFNQKTKFNLIQNGNFNLDITSKKNEKCCAFIVQQLRYKKEEPRYKNIRYFFGETYQFEIEEQLDFLYLDLCGELSPRLVDWFIYNKNKLSNTEMAFTISLSGMNRQKEQKNNKCYNYYGINKEGKYIGKDYRQTYSKLIILFFESLFKRKVQNFVIYNDTKQSVMCSFRIGFNKTNNIFNINKNICFHKKSISWKTYNVEYLFQQEFINKYIHIKKYDKSFIDKVKNQIEKYKKSFEKYDFVNNYNKSYI